MQGNLLVLFLEGLEAVTPPGYSARVQATCLPQEGITRCALTSPILASAISVRQDTEAFFAVLYVRYNQGIRHRFLPADENTQ
jgi:hypothetical protein